MSFDHVADTYDELRVIPDYVLHKFYETILTKEARSKRNLVVLDDGIGTARTVGPLVDMGIQLVGVDISKKMLNKAAERVKRRSLKSQVSLVRGDVTNLPFRPRSFDVVISVNVFWLLRRWKNAVLEARRVLRAEGYFIPAAHKSPEFQNEVGRKYLEVEQEAFGTKKIVRRVPILNSTSVGKKILENKTTKFFILAYDNITKYYSLESFLARKTRSLRRYVLTWKERADLSAIVNLLDKRLYSLKWSISNETFERLKLDLAEWKNREMNESSFTEIELEFEFNIVTFN